VVASGNPAPTYQWYFGGAAISGATSATLSLSNVQSANAGNYYVTVANSAGSVISATATLTVSAQSAATLVSGQFVAVGHEVAISALGAAGAIQWQVSTDGGATWQNISDGSSYSGTTSSTLEILNVSSAQNNTKYRVVTGGTASSATTLTVAQSYFTFPTSVGTDSAGNLYVSDAQLQTIQKISTSGQVTLVAGATGQSGSTSGNGSTARFNQPGALAAAPDGTLSVSDTSNDLVRSITTGGDVTTLAGSAGVAGTVDGTGAAARFSSPTGIARDSGSNLYVADSLNNTIRKITSAGVVSTLAGTAGTAGSADGTGTGASFKSPAGVAVDSAGNVYVSDTYNHTIRVIAAGGVVSTLAGQPGVSGTQDGTGSGARFNNPGGLAIGAAGEIYLADTGNSTIRKITPAGVVTTIAGLPGIAGLMDGTGAYAWFNQPDGLTLGADGNLYVADTGNALIRQVTLAGAVTTLPLATGATSGQTSGSTGSTGSTSGGSTTSAASGGGGGGGATSDWFALALAMICGLRCWQKKSVREGSNA
jgi:sugar lactone lactonase YvrE